MGLDLMIQIYFPSEGYARVLTAFFEKSEVVLKVSRKNTYVNNGG
jgi:hypothetical protein